MLVGRQRILHRSKRRLVRRSCVLNLAVLVLICFLGALLSRWHSVVDDEHYVVIVLGLWLLLRVFNARLGLLGICILSCE